MADFDIDATHDLVRAIRLPETRNWKPAYGPEGAAVTVREWSGQLLSRADLDRVAAAYQEPPKRTQSKRRASPRPTGEGSNGTLPSWPAVYAGCDVMREWADTIDGLPEPDWYALAGIVGHCDGGAEIFHELSQGDGRYDSAETDAKLAQAIKASAPRLCDGIAALGGNCNKCPFQGRINSPIALGYVSDPVVVELARRWAYIASQDAFVDLFALEAAQ